MEHYAGIDVSLESASVCVVDATGRIVREAKVASEPEVLIEWFRRLGFAVARIGLEAGPLSQWLYAGIREAGLAVELLETRHVRDAFKAMPVKTDRKDARGIAQLMRLGWFRPVHCKSLPAQEMRALLTARKLFSMSCSLLWISFRAVNIARISCALIDLQCTGRNQPSRISCAMLRASLRSDFTGIALKASLTCRVSRSSTARPACFIAA